MHVIQQKIIAQLVPFVPLLSRIPMMSIRRRFVQCGTFTTNANEARRHITFATKCCKRDSHTHTHINMQLTQNCSFAKFFVISSRNKSSLSLIDAKGAKSVFVCDFSIFTAKCVEIAIFMAFIFSQKI